MHPRVFAALGADLVTNDIVAVIELVKNAYDAFATRVEVNFRRTTQGALYLEILDNGHGMSREIVQEVFCVVATPYRVENPEAVQGQKTRRSSGAKGLGRLSAARLGGRLEITTRAKGRDAVKFKIDWTGFAARNQLSDCTVEVQEVPGKGVPFGTTLRIYDLKSDWDHEDIDELQDALSRLLSPFSSPSDFAIFLKPPDELDLGERVQVKVPKFLARPKYAIRGTVDESGTLHAKYEYSPFDNKAPHSAVYKATWEQLTNTSSALKRRKLPPEFGPFEFEVRAWDIGRDDTAEIANSFNVPKSSVRKAIRAHKGLSLYRDGILVLPKSEDSRDWLGLDLRRVSRVGSRLSTSQIIGSISISADLNPKLEDTSSREDLARNVAVTQFYETLRLIVSVLESFREDDRVKPSPKMEDLFNSISADELIDEMEELAERGASAEEALTLARKHGKNLEKTAGQIRSKFTYYSRLATIGTIAHMLVHEIRNRTTAIGNTLRYFQKTYEFEEELTVKKIASAESAVVALEGLASRFLPLASLGFRRRNRNSMVEERIAECVAILAGELRSAKIEVEFRSKSETHVAVDPGELDAILLNLFSNSIYWLGAIASDRKIKIQTRSKKHDSRVLVEVHDNGPGVSDDDAERIFRPGVTRKPGGVGMGLTVASEVVSEYGGKIFLEQPGRLGGATFAFDLPLIADESS